MPHPDDFNAAPRATTDAERRSWWANTPPEMLTEAVKSYAMKGSDEAALWLRSLMDMGGLCLERGASHLAALVSAPDPSTERMAMGGTLRINAVNCVMDGPCIVKEFIKGYVKNPLDGSTEENELGYVVYACNVSEGFKAFHADFCQMLVNDVLVIRAELEGPNAIMISDFAIQKNLAVALATACMLDAPQSVALIARSHPQAMKEMLPTAVLGTLAQTCFVKSTTNALVKPRVNAYFCAMQFSSPDSMDALMLSGFDASLSFGISKPKDNGPKPRQSAPFDVFSLCDVFHPACKPEVYEKALKDKISSASSESLTEMTERAIALFGQTHSLLGSFGYFDSLLDVGAFDANPTQSAVQACVHGHARIVEQLADRVDWRSQAMALQGLESPIHLSTKQSLVSDRRDQHDLACAAFFKGAVQAGFGCAAVVQSLQSMMGAGKYARISQPIHNLVMTDSRHTVRAMVDQGLDVHRRLSENAETVMELAVRSNTGMDHFILTLVAHQKAKEALAMIDADLNEDAASYKGSSGTVRP